MNKLFLVMGLGLLSFSVACGSGGGGGNGGFGTGGPTNNSKIKGQYAYQMTGIDLSTGLTFREAGVFTADGNGNITAGTDDFAEGSSVVTANTTGTYSINSDGTGSGTFAFSNGSGITAAFTVVSASQVDLIEIDAGATGAGTALLQTSSAFSAAPSGNFAFRFHSFSGIATPLASTSVGAVGAFTVSGGVAAGTEDVIRNSAESTLALTGLFNAPDAGSGRGTGNFNDGVATISFFYYVVDSNTILLFSQTNGAPGLGRAEKQSTTTFSTGSLSGGYAFGSRGDTNSVGVDGVRTVGQLTADGNGNITAGNLDSVQDGTSVSNSPFTGTYSVTSSTTGRTVLALSSGTEIAYLVSPSRAFFLVDDGSLVEDGTADLQQTGSFSNSSFTGTYVFVTDGFNNIPATLDRVGLMTPDGSGHMGLKYALNSTGSSSIVTLNGSYSVSANGRMTASVNTLSSNLVFYLVSGSQGYLLQNDSGTEIDGSITKQQ